MVGFLSIFKSLMSSKSCFIRKDPLLSFNISQGETSELNIILRLTEVSNRVKKRYLTRKVAWNNVYKNKKNTKNKVKQKDQYSTS